MSNDISNEDIQEYVRLVVDSGVAEMEVQRGDHRVRIRRTMDAVTQPQMQSSASAPAVDASGAPLVAMTPAMASAMPPQPAVTASSDIIVKSPIVGTYYDQAKPGDPPFVKTGDVIEPGQVLCIIESMKLMNEIESEAAGTVVAKLMENGRPVEYGEALFAIRPR